MVVSCSADCGKNAVLKVNLDIYILFSKLHFINFIISSLETQNQRHSVPRMFFLGFWNRNSPHNHEHQNVFTRTVSGDCSFRRQRLYSPCLHFETAEWKIQVRPQSCAAFHRWRHYRLPRWQSGICQEKPKRVQFAFNKDLYGWTMDEIVKQVGRKNNCTFCGVFRRQALDRGAALLKCDVIATGHNADDVAETVLMNLLRGDVARLQRCTAHITVRTTYIGNFIKGRNNNHFV